MKTVRKFKDGLKQSLFGKPKGKMDKMDVYAAHYLNHLTIWAFSKK